MCHCTGDTRCPGFKDGCLTCILSQVGRGLCGIEVRGGRVAADFLLGSARETAAGAMVTNLAAVEFILTFSWSPRQPGGLQNGRSYPHYYEATAAPRCDGCEHDRQRREDSRRALITGITWTRTDRNLAELLLAKGC